MGPIGFALALEAALDKCRDAERNIPWCTWYLDDGLLVGSLESVTDYMEVLVPALHDIGLQVNLSKCSLWGPGVQLADDMSDLIPDSTPIGHPIRHVPIVPYGGKEGITV